MRVVFPELKNSVAKAVKKSFTDVEFVPAISPDEGAAMLGMGKADSMISGLDYSSREIMLAFKAHLPLASPYFSSCFIGERDGRVLAIADGGVIKHPSAEQLYIITVDTARTFHAYTGLQPKIAMLSYSTHGSGGRDAELDKIRKTIEQVRREHPEYEIDGELQLDAAVNPAISRKKTPESVLKGEANVLIVPDLNSGNILYKSLEQFGGFTMAGPIVQGFKMPLADLSRGSTVEDIILTVKVLRSLL